MQCVRSSQPSYLAAAERRAAFVYQRAMGIDKFVRFGEDVLIDKELTGELIDIRNKLFHGGKEDPEDVRQRYKPTVEQLLFINEQIIGFARGQDAGGQEQTFSLFIEGNKNE